MEQGDRIAKYLSRAGIASRRDAEKLVEAGRIAVNGKVLDTPAFKVTPEDRVTFDGKPVEPPEATRLWRYHKPSGLVTSARDEKGRATVFDKMPPEMPRVLSVGRLDLNSEGLLLLTNDGALKRTLELPATGWTRRYRVRINGVPTEDKLKPLKEGMTVDRVNYQPMSVTLDKQQGANAWLTIGLREGKNREIRKALSTLGFSVNRLIRISYGPFQLGELVKGAVEEVRPRLIREQLGSLLAPTPASAKGAKSGRIRRSGPASRKRG